MSLLHTPRVALCAALSLMFSEQFKNLNDVEKLIALRNFAEKLIVTLDDIYSQKSDANSSGVNNEIS